MIVISQDLVLSPVDAEPLHNPVIGWENLADADNTSSTTEDDDHPISNVVNPSTNLMWRGVVDSPTVDEYITIDLSQYVGVIDYLAIARHNFGTAGIISSVEYLVVGESPENWEELVGEQIVADDAPIIYRFTPGAFTSVRLRMQPGSEAPELGVLYVGKLLVFERGVQGEYTPLPMARDTNIVSGVSEGGDFLGRIIVGGRSASDATFQYLTPAWIRQYLDPFLEASAEIPFFFSWCPQDYPDEVGFAWLENNAQPSFDVEGFGSVTFSMVGILS